MLGKDGFDLWADGYDRSVGLSDDDGTYPFAGYRMVLNGIFGRVLAAGARSVMDIGFGTATLTAKLYERGLRVYGQDFSARMIQLAQAKMPEALLVQGDFTEGLAESLRSRTYDAIIATYSLHHLTDAQKVQFLRSLLPLVNDGGCILIGDVAFRDRSALESCRVSCGDSWDDEEFYFVYDELREQLPELTFEEASFCAGILTIAK